MISEQNLKALVTEAYDDIISDIGSHETTLEDGNWYFTSIVVNRDYDDTKHIVQLSVYPEGSEEFCDIVTEIQRKLASKDKRWVKRKRKEIFGV